MGQHRRRSPARPAPDARPRWNADGQNVVNIIFPSGQLDEALAELDRLHRETLGDSIDPADGEPERC